MNVALTREQVRRVDRLAISRYRITGLVLMENAGRNAAEIIHRAYGPSGRVFIACGPGNNGGDGCVIARHLHNFGWSVRLLIAGEVERMAPDMRANFDIIEAMGLDCSIAPDSPTRKAIIETMRQDEVLVDALLGTGFRGQVRSPTAELMVAIGAAPRRAVVAVDLPSGLDCDTGAPANAVIRADLTITFVAEKTGFSAESAAPFIGRVEVADIGAPRELVADILSEAS